ncbi:MAG: hypothetical protein ABI583_10980 [Betaproteobacteria bacterium]
MGMAHLLITVDTEISNFPNGMGLWGRIGNEYWGLTRLLDTFEDIELKGTFFLDVYAQTDFDIADQRRAAELISRRGHDLQLHTHPGPAFERARDQLRHYTLAEQEEILEFGCRRIEEWSGTRPVLHRAGDWAADHNSLLALRTKGFRADFSASPWSKNCGLDHGAINGNGWTHLEGMLCGIGTHYIDRLTGRTRRVDLGGVSFREAIDMLSRGIDPFFLTLHSFSLLRYNKSRTRFTPNTDYIRHLHRFCEIAREQWGYQTLPALEAVNAVGKLTSESLPWANLPMSQAVSSVAGVMNSVRGRLSDLMR